MLTVHGRTREQGYQGQAEYDTIAAVKAQVAIPVWWPMATSPARKRRAVLACTGADAIMIGRAAQGRPWIFREIGHFLATGETLAPPWWPRCGACCWTTCRTTTSSTAKQRRAQCAQAHWLVRAGCRGRGTFDNTSTPSPTAVRKWQAGHRFFDALGRAHGPPARPDHGVHGEPQEQEGLTA